MKDYIKILPAFLLLFLGSFLFCIAINTLSPSKPVMIGISTNLKAWIQIIAGLVVWIIALWMIQRKKLI